MKLVFPETRVLFTIDPLKNIELAGRICYKSDDKITENSHIPFIKGIKERGHTSVLEHGALYLKLSWHSLFDPSAWTFYRKSLFDKYTVVRGLKIYTNYRVLFERHSDKIPVSLHTFVPNEIDNQRRVSVLFICDRGVSHELVRHRVASFSQESTRFCNYLKDKFGAQLTFIIPGWMNDYQPTENASASIDDAAVATLQDELFWDSESGLKHLWLISMQQAESNYLEMISRGWKAQQARTVLPNSLKTELVMTASLKQWKEIFRLRTAKDAHPQMIEIMNPLLQKFQIVYYRLFN